MNNSASRYKWHANHRLTDCKLEVAYRKKSSCASTLHDGRLQLKCDGTRWRTGGEVTGKLANGVGSHYPSHYLTHTSELSAYSITTADAHTSAASSRMIWRLHQFKWTRPFRRKTKSGFCACAITFQLASNYGGMTSHQYWSTFRATFHRTVLLPGVKSTYLTNCSLSVDTVYYLRACLIKFLRKGRPMFPDKSPSTATFHVFQVQSSDILQPTKWTSQPNASVCVSGTSVRYFNSLIVHRGVDYPLQFSANVKERLELHMYSASGPSWLVLGWTLQLYFVKGNLIGRCH
jgi:hypothetical protein